MRALLTVEKLRREYAYLRVVYAAMLRLIPWQRLVMPHASHRHPAAPLFWWRRLDAA